MARHPDPSRSAIYELAAEWRESCLVKEGSLIWPGEKVWTSAAFAGFKACFIDNPNTSDESFEVKFRAQLDEQDELVTKLACELVLVYFLFPSSVSGRRKLELIVEIANWKGIDIPATARDKLKLAFAHGIGSTGQRYNTRRPFEMMFLGRLGIDLLGRTADERTSILRDHLAFREIVDEINGNDDGPYQNREILLHLLFPDHYERIASKGHKAQIEASFREILNDEDAIEHVDDRILAIRNELTDQIAEPSFDFYLPPLRDVWYLRGDADDLNPLDGLDIKGQIVLFGPPGTGKTFEARQLAGSLIRKSLLKKWGPKKFFGSQEEIENLVVARTRRIQFHPGYSYEELVRGLQLVEGGKTEYRSGVLLKIIEELGGPNEVDFHDVPFVVVLDEMNRADLSKVLGECFSLFEDRGEPVQLAGQDKSPMKVAFPKNLHFVGTMNLIDQSLEQIDFALRRRFLWFFRGFDREQFMAIAEYRWDEIQSGARRKKEWSKYESEFEVLAQRAEKLNQLIAEHALLGSEYEIGHTYFADIVAFILKDLASHNRQYVMFSKKGRGRPETVGVLWKYSLRPLLEQYLSGVETIERDGFLKNAYQVVLEGNG